MKGWGQEMDPPECFFGGLREFEYLCPAKGKAGRDAPFKKIVEEYLLKYRCSGAEEAADDVPCKIFFWGHKKFEFLY